MFVDLKKFEPPFAFLSRQDFIEKCLISLNMEKGKDSTEDQNKTITLIYHNGAESIECHCGRIINGRHECTTEEATEEIQVIECAFTKWNDNYCSVCMKDAKQKDFDDQWYTDEDGYLRCSTCDVKCEYAEFPKDCGCLNDESSEED